MLANLQQLSLSVWAVAVLVTLVVTGIIIWARRKKFRVTKVEVTAGPLKAELEPEKSTDASNTAVNDKPSSVNISGNKLFGRTKINVRREGTNISDNVTAGEAEIEVGAKPGPKPKKQEDTKRA
jgi:hypothetical protein